MLPEKDTESRVFESAKAVFFEQGFHGARMAEIARRAGINQSMLHYYFRSKDQLFDAVFEKAASEAIPPVLALLLTDMPIADKIERFATGYIDMVSANPHLPAFILQELRRNPEALKRFVGTATEGLVDRLRREVNLAADNGHIRRVDPGHLVANVLALCIFPFIARPMLQTAFAVDDPAYSLFLEQRRQEVSDFIRNALRP